VAALVVLVREEAPTIALLFFEIDVAAQTTDSFVKVIQKIELVLYAET